MLAAQLRLKQISRRFHMAALSAGAPASDFTLTNQAGEKVSLASFKGRRTVVSFLPFAFTGG
jgi:peroxiredoxin